MDRDFSCISRCRWRRGLRRVGGARARRWCGDLAVGVRFAVGLSRGPPAVYLPVGDDELVDARAAPGRSRARLAGVGATRRQRIHDTCAISSENDLLPVAGARYVARVRQSAGAAGPRLGLQCRCLVRAHAISGNTGAWSCVCHFLWAAAGAHRTLCGPARAKNRCDPRSHGRCTSRARRAQHGGSRLPWVFASIRGRVCAPDDRHRYTVPRQSPCLHVFRLGAAGLASRQRVPVRVR